MEPVGPADLVPTVGLEIHAQLATRTKLFCACASAVGDAPNTRVCPVCLGLPGSLPVLGRAAVRLALRAAVALDCEVRPRSRFARKNYFYPDLPRNYQITQHDAPLAVGGAIRALDAAGREITCPLERLHLEEDAGRLVHDTDRGEVRVDLNRAGTPLVEIVTRPALDSGGAARLVLQAVRQWLRELGVCDGNLEAGNLRCDANVSLRPRAASRPGVRVELKNLNSYRFLQQAVDAEIARQAARLRAGGTIRPETRGWDPRRRVTIRLRGKEAAADYRYLPEPDLPDLVLTPGEIAAARAALPPSPLARVAEVRARHGLPHETATALAATPAAAAYFARAAAACGDGAAAARWCLGEVRRLEQAHGLAAGELPVTPEELADLIRRETGGEVTAAGAREALAAMADGEGTAAAVIAARGLQREGDPERLRVLCREALARHPAQAAAWRAGEAKLLGFFIGQVMTATQGRADPRLVRDLLANLRDDQGP